MQNIIASLSRVILIPNWFEKKHVEFFMNMELTDLQYKKIIEFCNEDSTLADLISKEMREFLLDNTDKIIEYLGDEE